MCGLVALWDGALDARMRARTAAALSASLAHRGPDGSGVWSSELAPLTLAHRRLAIRDRSTAGAQPMLSSTGRSALVFTGELFAVERIREELASRGVAFHGVSDTEVLARALETWGVTRTLEQVRGQFAFAWFDESHRRLVLARDHVGIRPMYYAHVGERLVVASEQKAILACPWVSRGIDREGAVRFLAMGRTDDVPFATLVDGIRSLPAGHVATFDGRALSVSRYSRLAVAVAPSSVSDVRAELERAVEEQLVGDVAIGSLVSGGVDSSVVTGLADRVRCRRGDTAPLHLFAYHDALAGPDGDERPYQAAALDGVVGPKEIHWVSGSPAELASTLSSYIEHQEEPYGDASSFAELCIARAARAVGVKVLLSGLGGDEAFLGYPSFLGPLFGDLIRAGAWHAAADVLRAVSDVRPGARHAELDVALGAAYHALPFRVRSALTAFRSARAASLGASKALGAAWDARRVAHRHDGTPHTNGALRGAIESWSVPRFLLHSDRMTLACGVEGRVPLLDVGVLRAAFGTPLVERVGTTGLKAALRAAASDVLPRIVRERSWKLGFHVPLSRYTDALEDPLRAGHATTARLVGGLPEWESLDAGMRWRSGMLGAYVTWVTTRPVAEPASADPHTVRDGYQSTRHASS